MSPKKEYPLISIILPTYNVAPYLRQCLESITAQTYKNYEVIIVIDGATDGSYEIAKDFSKEHDKFSVVWQENAGSGPARNNGIEHANGDLIMFIDPDDWIGPQHISNLVSKQLECDFDLTVSCRCQVNFDKKNNVIRKKDLNPTKYEKVNADEIHVDYFNLRNHLFCPTNRLYKLSIIKDNDVYFPEWRRSQDIAFNYRYFEHIQSMAVIPIADYFYRVEYTQIMLKIPNGYYKTIVLMHRDIEDMHKRLNISYPRKIACTASLRQIISTLEVLTIREESFDDMLSDLTINNIIDGAQPTGLFKKIQRIVVSSKNDFLIRSLMRMKYVIKKANLWIF